MATTPVFLPGKFQGLRSLARYSPWGCKESDTTEQLTHTQRKVCFLRIEKNYNFDYKMSQVREKKKSEATEKSGLVPWYAGATCYSS